MTSIVVERTADTERERSPFTGAARWVAGAVVLAGGLLQAVEFLLEHPLDDNAARITYWSEHLARIGWSQAAGLAAIPFLIVTVLAVVALTRRRSPRLAWCAGVLMTLAMVGLAAIHGYELAAYGLLRSGDHGAAVSVLNAGDLGVGGVVLFVMFLGGAALGTLALAAAEWRSPWIPRAVPVLVLAFAVLDFVVGWGTVSHVVQLAGDAVLAVAVVSEYHRRGAQ